MNVQIETTKYFSVERFQSFKFLENSTIMQGFSNPYIALIGRNPFRACFYWNATFYYFQPRMAFIAILNHFGLFRMKRIPKIVGQNFRISGHSVLNLRKICSARLIFSIFLCNVWLGLNLRGILVWKLSSFELEKHCQN